MTDQKHGPVMEHIPQGHDKAALAAWNHAVIERARPMKSDAEVASLLSEAGGVGSARAQALETSTDPDIKLSGPQISALYLNYQYVKWIGDTATGYGVQYIDGVPRPFTADWHGVNTYGNQIVPWAKDE